MPLAACARCNKMFQKTVEPVCPKCEPDEQDDYEKVRITMQNQPNLSAEDLAEAADVDIECVLRLLDSGRIETAQASTTVRCGRCGSPAISISKKLCEACLSKLNAKLATEQAKIRLPSKKDVAVGTALNVPDTMDSKRATGGRKNLMRRDGE
ncbi:MAG: hypothetical protein GY851_19410 [bacterium]|nr:hypothetical protein [bacterium]